MAASGRGEDPPERGKQKRRMPPGKPRRFAPVNGPKQGRSLSGRQAKCGGTTTPPRPHGEGACYLSGGVTMERIWTAELRQPSRRARPAGRLAASPAPAQPRQFPAPARRTGHRADRRRGRGAWRDWLAGAAQRVRAAGRGQRSWPSRRRPAGWSYTSRTDTSSCAAPPRRRRSTSSGPRSRPSLPTMLDHAPLALAPSAPARPLPALRGRDGRVPRHAARAASFVEIQTPKIVASATEGGANVFAVDYFGRRPTWRRARSSTSRSWSASSSACSRSGPVFRAEPHDTPRHLNEYVSLDVEMGFIDDHTHGDGAARRDVLARHGRGACASERGRRAGAARSRAAGRPASRSRRSTSPRRRS